MYISILEPKGVIWQGSVKKTILPAQEGEVCILDSHQSFFMRLKKGEIRVVNQRVSVKEGIAFMRANELKVFVER